MRSSALLLAASLSLTQAFPTLSLSSITSIVKRDAPYATTSNELTDGTPCRDVTLIYARGTTQDGNIGAAGDVGPFFFNNISAIIGNDRLAVQGVDYDADIDGFLGNLFGTSEEGVQTMTDLVTLVSTLLPADPEIAGLCIAVKSLTLFQRHTHNAQTRKSSCLATAREGLSCTMWRTTLPRTLPL